MIPRSTAMLSTLLLFASLGCGESAPDRPAAREDHPSGEASPATADTPAPGAVPVDTVPAPATRIALPGLFSIMAGLEDAMARIDRGLWTERFDTIAAGARAVADHPAIRPAEAERIRSVLGADMARFQALDRRVHDLAVRIAEGADRGALEDVLDAQASLRSGCVTCHTEFRERLRVGLR